MANPPNEFWTKEQLKDLISYASEMQALNETLQAKLIAMNAKLTNEESKVKRLTQTIQYITGIK